MNFKASMATAILGLALSGFATQSMAVSYSEGFDTVGVIPTGWSIKNNSTRNTTGNPWGVGEAITDDAGTPVVTPYAGDAFALANYTSVGSGTGTISNWLISPEFFGMRNGDKFSFFTTTTPASDYPDRLEFRMSTGAGVNVGTTVTSVGTFTNTLLSINSGLAVGGYPDVWTQYTVTLSGLAAPIDGRVAFRYFVTSGGPTGANSNIIGVDSFSYVSAVPEAGTLAMSLGGLLGLMGLARVRREKASQA